MTRLARRGAHAAAGGTMLLLLLAPSAGAQGCTTTVHRLSGDGRAVDVNDLGTVVGRYHDDTVLWRGGARSTIVRGARPAEINNHDTVVGYKQREDRTTRAFSWHEGRITLLPGRRSGALAVNDSGWVVGWVAREKQYRPALWRQGRLTLLPLPAGVTSAVAADVNAGGDIVGFSGTNHGFLWRQGRVVELQPEANAYVIDDSGHISGSLDYGDGAAPAPFVWSSPTSGRSLGFEGGFGDSAGDGRFVGAMLAGDHGDPSRDVLAITWDGESGTRVLPTLSGRQGYSVAAGANNAGTVVGESEWTNGWSRPTLWRCAWGAG